MSSNKPDWKHSKECMCGLWNIDMGDYQESVTTHNHHYIQVSNHQLQAMLQAQQQCY